MKTREELALSMVEKLIVKNGTPGFMRYTDEELETLVKEARRIAEEILAEFEMQKDNEKK